MNKQHFPPGWDEDRVKRLIAHYDSMTEEEQVAEDEAAVSEQQGRSSPCPTHCCRQFGNCWRAWIVPSSTR